MVRAVTESAREPYKHPEDTMYQARLNSVEQLNYTIQQGKRAGEIFSKWRWSFEITEGQFTGDVLTVDTEARLDMSTLQQGSLRLVRPIVEALTGTTLVEGTPFDSDNYTQVPCRITVKHLPAREKKDGGGFWYDEEVLDIFPAPAYSASSAPPF